MRQVLITRDGIAVDEVPDPVLADGCVLVEVHASCISPGTETAGVQQVAQPLWKRALKEPHKVAKVLKMAAEQGIARTTAIVQGKLASGTPTGYSCAGAVIAAAGDVEGIHPGDLVACAGAGYANHAEKVCVPVNLVIPVPPGLSVSDAGSVALGAIAMQGVRRCAPEMGEIVAVLGLGLLGQLTCQMLVRCGARVVGMDLDPRRVEMARSFGIENAMLGSECDVVAAVRAFTGNHGADAVLVCASTPSDDPLSQALRMCRRRGRVVIVGDVGLKMNRADLYRPELEVKISTSYGPGRYDSLYEEGGETYPYAYVRWTETRNMAEYLRLLASGAVSFRKLNPVELPVDRAPEAYKMLKAAGDKPLCAVLTYPAGEGNRPAASPRVAIETPSPKREGAIAVALIGAGGFIKGMHLPNLKKMSDRFRIHAVVSRETADAKAVAAQAGAAYATADWQQVIEDPEVEMVLVATPHELHAPQSIAALRKGKAVFVEKPMAMNLRELDEVSRAVAETGRPYMAGFNRRFSPHAVKIAEALRGRSGPMSVIYNLRAPAMPHDNILYSPAWGGRIIGEACHFFEFFGFLAGPEAQVTGVTARPLRFAPDVWHPDDNFSAQVSFSDGSVMTLHYVCAGAPGLPKETVDISCDGKTLILEDYRRLAFHGMKRSPFETSAVDKGHMAEMELFGKFLRGESKAPPLTMAAMELATRVAIEVDRQVRGRG